MTILRRRLRLAFALAAGLGLASCGGGGSVDNQLSFRVIQASPDLPVVNILVDGARLQSVDYKGGTSFIFVTPRTYQFGIEAVVPQDDELFIDESQPLAAGKEYTVIAIGKDAADAAAPDRLRALVIENDVEVIPAGNTRLQIVHAAPDAPTVDIYLTGPGASLPAATPIDQVTYGEVPADRQLVPPGTYVVSVTPAGDPNTVLFQSRELIMRSRDDLLLVAVTNTAAGSSPISLVVNDGFSILDVLDRNAPSNVRVVHVSPDAPALNVVGDPATTASPEVTFASALTYLGFTNYVAAPPDTYTIRGVKSSDPTPTTPPFTLVRSLPGGERSTVFAIGLLATIGGLAANDSIRSVFSEGKLRIVDAAPAGGTVDTYVLKDDVDFMMVDPTLRNFVLGTNTGHLGFPPGNYVVTFTKAGTKEVVATRAVAATAGTVQTLILVDEVRVEGDTDGKPSGTLLLDDLAS